MIAPFNRNPGKELIEMTTRRLTFQKACTRVTRVFAYVLIVLAVFAACFAQPATFGIALLALVIAVALITEARFEERQERKTR